MKASAIPLGFSFTVLGVFRIFIRKLDQISDESQEDEKNKWKRRTNKFDMLFNIILLINFGCFFFKSFIS